MNQGRDEALLCSLSNFDAYYVTRSHRAPKPFAFTVKSTDKLSLFENTADYMHTFACSEKNGEVWVEKILLARVRRSSVVPTTGFIDLNLKSLTFSRTSCVKNELLYSIRKMRTVIIIIIIVKRRTWQGRPSPDLERRRRLGRLSRLLIYLRAISLLLDRCFLNNSEFPKL